MKINQLKLSVPTHNSKDSKYHSLMHFLNIHVLIRSYVERTMVDDMKINGLLTQVKLYRHSNFYFLFTTTKSFFVNLTILQALSSVMGKISEGRIVVYHVSFQIAYFLQDIRVSERKKPGKPGARKSPVWKRR